MNHNHPCRFPCFFFALLAALALAGCSSRQSSGDAMAKVNGKNILRADVEKYYRMQMSQSP